MPEKKITIEINRAGAGLSAKPKQSKPQAASKGVIRSRRENDYLARRPKKGGFINFYDLGEWLNDDTSLFVDDAYKVIPTISAINAGETEDYSGEILAAQNKPLDIPLDAWKTNFHKIGYAEAVKYRLSVDIGNDEPDLINAGNPRWTPQGLKTNNEGFEFASFINAQMHTDTVVYYDRLAMYSSNGIFRYFFNDDSDFKITSEPDYGADAVELNLTKGNIDIYINRTIHKTTGFKDKYSGVTLIEQKELNHFYSAIPKSVFGNDELRTERNISDTDELIQDMLIAQTTHPDARQLNNSGGVYSLDGGVTGWDTTGDDYELAVTFDETRLPGMLFLAINKGADWYFVWWDS